MTDIHGQCSWQNGPRKKEQNAFITFAIVKHLRATTAVLYATSKISTVIDRGGFGTSEWFVKV